MRIAVITLVAGRHRHLALQQHGLARSTRLPGHYVVVTMADPGAADALRGHLPVADVAAVPRADGGGLPLAAARNAGARRPGGRRRPAGLPRRGLRTRPGPARPLRRADGEGRVAIG